MCVLLMSRFKSTKVAFFVFFFSSVVCANCLRCVPMLLYITRTSCMICIYASVCMYVCMYIYDCMYIIARSY